MAAPKTRSQNPQPGKIHIDVLPKAAPARKCACASFCFYSLRFCERLPVAATTAPIGLQPE